MKEHYEVVAAVVVCAGRVMCLRKGVTRFAYTSHRWEFPGGKIEAGESAQAALHRELREELGLDIEVGRHLITVEHAYPDFDITLHAYACTAQADTVHLTEHEALRWLPVDQLNSLQWCDADAPIAHFLTKQSTDETISDI